MGFYVSSVRHLKSNLITTLPIVRFYIIMWYVPIEGELVVPLWTFWVPGWWHQDTIVYLRSFVCLRFLNKVTPRRVSLCFLTWPIDYRRISITFLSGLACWGFVNYVTLTPCKQFVWSFCSLFYVILHAFLFK